MIKRSECKCMCHDEGSTLRHIAPCCEENSIKKQWKPFPDHWGNPPVIQSHDIVRLPNKYGFGSSCLRSWIMENLERDDNG